MSRRCRTWCASSPTTTNRLWLQLPSELRPVRRSQRFGDGDGSCGAAIEPGVAGRTAFTLRVQTGCARAVLVLHHSGDAGRAAKRRRRRCADAKSIGSIGAGFKEIALTGVHLGSYGRDLIRRVVADRAAAASRGRDIGRGPAERTACVLFRISSLEPMDCSRRSSIWSRLESLRAAFPPAAAARRATACWRRCAGRTPIENTTRRSSTTSARGCRTPRSAPTSSSVSRARPTRISSSSCAYLDASPLTHVHVFPYSDRPGTAASSMGEKVPGARGSRAGASGARNRSAADERDFASRRSGAVHRALTIEDGTLAVTGNYLKVQHSARRADQ